ncbi:MAG: c-type cytochrome [Solirubrobacteraceae bacterium]
MNSPLKLTSRSLFLVAVAVVTAACGTQKISVPTSNTAAHAGAVLFSQRCAGCHTFSYAATHGSAANIRDRQPINGPNFNVRCERPIARVLYAIENGGFSGAYMPQNIVVGEQAREVATFVSEYAGRQAPPQPLQKPCSQQAIGSLNVSVSTGTTAASGAGGTTGGTGTTSVPITPTTSTVGLGTPYAAGGASGASGLAGSASTGGASVGSTSAPGTSSAKKHKKK